MSTGNIPRRATQAQTWAAEERANQNLRMQDAWEAGEQHKCGNCYGPFGLSAIKCKNA